MLNQDGFLSTEIEKIEKDIKSEYSFAFDKVKDYNKFFQETAFKFIIKGNPLHLSLAALYLRSLSTYQSIILLSKRGITREGNVLLRSLFEIKYIIIALSKFPSLINEYLGQEAVEMKKILKNSRKWEEQLTKGISVKEIEYKLKEVVNQISQYKFKKYTIRNFAERAGLLMDYELNYSMLCLTGHSNIFDIKKHFVLDKNGMIVSFNWGPNKNDVTNLLGIASETMFAILGTLRDIFSLQIEEEYDLHFTDYHKNRTKFIKHT